MAHWGRYSHVSLFHTASGEQESEQSVLCLTACVCTSAMAVLCALSGSAVDEQWGKPKELRWETAHHRQIPQTWADLGNLRVCTRWDTLDSVNEPAYKPKPRTTFKFFYLHWVCFSPEKWGDTMLSQVYCVNCRSRFCCCLLLLWERLWYLFWRYMMLFSIDPVGNCWFGFASFLVPYPRC